MKTLSYHHIMAGGVPMTEAGVKRFIASALIDGYDEKTIISYLEEMNNNYKIEKECIRQMEIEKGI